MILFFSDTIHFVSIRLLYTGGQCVTLLFANRYFLLCVRIVEKSSVCFMLTDFTFPLPRLLLFFAVSVSY